MATIQKTHSGYQVALKKPIVVKLTTDEVKLYRKNGTVRLIVDLDESAKQKIEAVETKLSELTEPLERRGTHCSYKSMISAKDGQNASVFLFVPKADHAKISSPTVSLVNIEITFTGMTIRKGSTLSNPSERGDQDALAYPSYLTKYTIKASEVEELEI